MKEKRLQPLELENAVIGYRNFAGAEGPYNKAGDRNFAVFFDPELALELAEEGWNVKWPKERDDIPSDQDDRRPWLDVAVSFKNIPPKVVVIVNDNVEVFEEEQISALDYAELAHVDLILSPYHYNVNGNTGVKAYLKSMYATLVSDRFIEKYGV